MYWYMYYMYEDLVQQYHGGTVRSEQCVKRERQQHHIMESPSMVDDPSAHPPHHRHHHHKRSPKHLRSSSMCLESNSPRGGLPNMALKSSVAVRKASSKRTPGTCSRVRAAQ